MNKMSTGDFKAVIYFLHLKREVTFRLSEDAPTPPLIPPMRPPIMVPTPGKIVVPIAAPAVAPPHPPAIPEALETRFSA